MDSRIVYAQFSWLFKRHFASITYHTQTLQLSFSSYAYAERNVNWLSWDKFLWCDLDQDQDQGPKITRMGIDESTYRFLWRTVIRFRLILDHRFWSRSPQLRNAPLYLRWSIRISCTCAFLSALFSLVLACTSFNLRLMVIVWGRAWKWCKVTGAVSVS